MLKPRLAASLLLPAAGLLCVCLTNSSTQPSAYAQQAGARYTTNHRDAARKYLKKALYSKALEEAEAELKFMPDSAPALLLKSQALIGIYAEEYSILTTESREACFMEITETAERMEKYPSPSPQGVDADEWREQLDILHGYIRYRRSKSPADSKPDVYAPKEMTTKARILSKPAPSYDGSAQGTVVIRAVLSAEGRVEGIVIIQRLNPETTRAAMKAARKIKFVPATIDGRPVSQYIQIEYNFLVAR